ncbi:NlpC/P60 family protein [Priestia megaterium]|uniref:NlpC/P60 family protein n=1 Tax=Priestia megaterium TaxID=1404 RepID=UPI002E23166A|nr:NlpC/P60 family protein [Priestia megaterium]
MKKVITFLITFLLIPSQAMAAHSVKSGDTMWKISQQYKMSYADLISLNPQISNPALINVGDKIAVRSGDTATDLTDYAKNLQSVTSYLYGGNNPPYKTDCSGWTQHIYAKFGISLPRVSRQQANVGTPITFQNMKKGDLMFFSSNSDKVINHVGIYLGNGYWISNLNSQYHVKIQSIYDSYTQKYFLWAQRVI